MAFVTTKPVRIVVKPTNVPDTRLAEGAQCVYLAARQFARKDIDSDAVKRTMVRTASRVQIDIPTTNIVDKLSPTWQRSSEKIANYLGVYLKRQDYVFHRNSPVVKQIYFKFSELNKAEGKPFAQSDKWQPADIWAIAGKVDVSRIKTIDQLNRYFKDKIDAGLIIPISLKQSVGKKVVKATRMNIDPQKKAKRVDLPKFDQTLVSTGGKDWTSSKMVKIDVDLEQNKRGYFELRQSKPGADVNAEFVIRGSPVRHGKLRRQVILDALKHAGSNLKLPDERAINKASIAGDNDLIIKTYNLAQELAKANLSLDQFQAFIEEKHLKDPNWLASKYIGMLYIQAVNKLPAQKQNQFVAELYTHALAAGDLTAPFIKVE